MPDTLPVLQQHLPKLNAKPLLPARLPSTGHVQRAGKRVGDVEMDTPMEMVSNKAASPETASEDVI